MIRSAITARPPAGKHVGKAVDGPVEIINWWHQECVRDRRARKAAELKETPEFLATPEGEAAKAAFNRDLKERANRPPSHRGSGEAGGKDRCLQKIEHLEEHAQRRQRDREAAERARRAGGFEAITAFLKGTVDLDLETVELAMQEIAKIHSQARVHQADVGDW